MIDRTFEDQPNNESQEDDQQILNTGLFRSGGITWEHLLQSKRVLIVSEAGTGKTYECKTQAEKLFRVGEPAFFIELADLAKRDLRNQLEEEEKKRLEVWCSSQSEIETFFLDSIDELKLTRSSFELALKRFSNEIGSQRLGRARIVVTTRPIPYDEQLIRNKLPISPVASTQPSGETFAEAAMGKQLDWHAWDNDNDDPPDWRTVGLLPLSDPQIIEFARGQGVNDPEALLEDLESRNAQEFAQRPQDLIELCAGWRAHPGKIQTHRDQVKENVRVKLLPRDDRTEPAELSVDRAIEGAARLALAMQMTRRMTIRHSAESDQSEDEAALDPAKILSDWNQDERKALLERPLFIHATYGRVRFHHRSVTEYLAAERLRQLRGRGMPFCTLKELLFVQVHNKMVVRPSKRPIAGWLALEEKRIFEMLRDNEPAVLLEEGDPEGLSELQRKEVLRAYVEHHGRGGRRRHGLGIPQHSQVYRFASSGLAGEIIRLWKQGIENPDVRVTLLRLVEKGSLSDCTDIAYGVACDSGASWIERILAIDALVTTQDTRLKDIVLSVATQESQWSDRIALDVVLRLFPQHLSVDQCCQVLNRIQEGTRNTSNLEWQLPDLISNAELGQPDLEELRDGLVQLVSCGLRYEWPRIVCDRPQLGRALAATCLRGLNGNHSNDWLSASVLAVRLCQHNYNDDEICTPLYNQLTNLSGEENARLFWVEDSLVQSLTIDNPWMRSNEITGNHGTVQLHTERDLGWIKEALGDTARSTDDRAMLLQAAMRLAPNPDRRRDHVAALKPLVADVPDLVAVIDKQLRPPDQNKEVERYVQDMAERQQRQKQQYEKKKERWIEFWQEVAEHPEKAFADGQSRRTVRGLWRAMNPDGVYGQGSGWNRRLIEKHFGAETADRSRQTLMKIWRENRPILPSEQSGEPWSTILREWQLGLAALYAEAEDTSWATKLTEEEAKLAARYAPIRLDGWPEWMGSLVDAHAEAVDAVLGPELDWELESDPQANGHFRLLEHITYTSTKVAGLFLPQLRKWLEKNGGAIDEADDLDGSTRRIQLVIEVLLKHGDENIHECMHDIACQHLQDGPRGKLDLIWLPVLMRIDPDQGILVLVDRIQAVKPEQYSEAVQWFSALFGDRRNAINLKSPAFTPQLLLQLFRLAYRHVRHEDDIQHDGIYTPNTRDHAQQARNNIVNALLDASGEEGWDAKQEMADDPSFVHSRDHILAVAQENLAQELDCQYDEEQAIKLDKLYEAPPSTNQAMFTLMCDRLADLDEELLADDSPREAWALITEEKVMRRMIARELHLVRKGLYQVDQESVTGEEKRTDIRLRSTKSGHEAVIELKLAEKWSARELLDTICSQLVRKYMAPGHRKSGCLLITLAKKDKYWMHPENRTRIGPEELVSLLCDEATRVEEKLRDGTVLDIHLLDLRPRLPVGQETKKTKNIHSS
ncbi:MAG: ATP-binding protein [Gammaproteobacteria bacterium]|nr:ATP-binding protein [Gammaproteobacteria bacterium]